MALGELVATEQALQGGIMARTQTGSQDTNWLNNHDQPLDGRQYQDAEAVQHATNSFPYLAPNIYLSDANRDAYEVSASSVGPAESGVVSKWRMKDRMKTGCVALVLCLNIGVDPPDIIKISPCARMECWIDPFSMSATKALEAIGKNLQAQYERWQPKARYRVQLDPTVEELKKFCTQCRKSAKSERVLFHYNGHGVPKPTVNGEIWLFNRSYTQYIPLSVYDVESWLGTPSIYVFDCSAAGMILNAFREHPEWNTKDCILLAACGANEILPQHVDLPADVFTACLTTPIKIALRWFCPRSLLRDYLDPDLIDRIPGRQNDRKTPLGELNWIFTAITDTIAWNVLPRELFQRLFRQDLLVASLFRNFLLAERIMRAANCTPLSHPLLPPTHQHPMWHAWDMAAEMCLSQLPGLLNESAEFRPSTFFSEQLTAFEVWLEHGSETKKPPEQLPIVLQVLLSQSHRHRALVLLGKFLDMGAWAVDLALSVGIFPYVLKLLQTTAIELRQILVFIWTKILALDKSCQVDLVKDSGHQYFIRFLDAPEIFAEQRAMAAFVLAVIVDGHRRGQEECMQLGLISNCLKHIQIALSEGQPEPILLQWLCLCVGKIWDHFDIAQQQGIHCSAPAILKEVLTEPQPEVRASATFALGTLIPVSTDVVSDCSSYDEDDEDEERHKAEQGIVDILLSVLYDGSPLVRAELAIGLSRFAIGHNKQLKPTAAAYLRPPQNTVITSLPSLAPIRSPAGSLNNAAQMTMAMMQSPALRVGSDSAMSAAANASSPSCPTPMQGSPSSDGALYQSEGSRHEQTSNGAHRPRKLRADESNFYSRCVSAMYALGRDPSPRVGSLGRQVLRIIGVEPVIVNPTRVGGSPGPGSSSGHQRTSSIGAVPPAALLPRSFSWIDSPSANYTVTFRTPPASPPTGQSVLTGNGMRRVCSLEFSPHLRRAADSGLADTALVGGGTSQSLEAVSLPSSQLYKWSSARFAKPLLETYHSEDDEAITRRRERETLALDGITKCQHCNVRGVYDQTASFFIDTQNSFKAVLLHPFLPIVCAADEFEVIRVWDYEEGSLVNVFENHNAPDKEVSGLCLLNELDDSLLLVASSDGCVRVWKDYTQKSKSKLVTAWQTLEGYRPGGRSMNTVVDWQQSRGYLYASGEVALVAVWDLSKETLAFNIQSKSDSTVSSLSASQGLGQYVAAGFNDGTVKVFDIRSRDIVYSATPHRQKVVRVDFLPGLDSSKIVSASGAGDLKFFDLRRPGSGYMDIDTRNSSLSAMAVHRHAPLIATGFSKQFIRFYSIHGEQLSVIRYHNSFYGQRIGPVSALSFHPYKVCLASGSTDSNVSVYSGDNGLS